MAQHQNNLVVYQAKNGAIELKQDTNADTIWATQIGLFEIFAINHSVLPR